MLPWKTILQLDRDSVKPMYLQIVNAMIREINRGRLQRGQELPGSRLLASQLEVNRKTVIQAYDELVAQGWLEIKASKGTFVSTAIPQINYRPLDGKIISRSQKPLHFKQFDFIEGYDVPLHAKQFIEDGSPDHRLAPMDWIYKESRSLIRSRVGEKLLKYNDVKGDPKLREVLAKYLGETRGVPCERENILITRGSQMGIYLTLHCLLDPGEIGVVAETSYEATDWVFEHLQSDLKRVPVDDEGIQVESLDRLCEQHHVKAVYITPHHHFPTGVTLSNERRIKLLDLAYQQGFAIIEDDYDYDFHYTSSPILPLASLDQHQRVIYIGSFSKIFAPSVRIGYVVASEEMVEQLSRLRRIIDRQGDPIMERVIANAITEGELQRHLKKSVRIYKNRRDLFCHLLTSTFEDKVEFKVPEGGMAVWVHFKPSFDLESFLKHCDKKGIYLNINKDHLNHHRCVRMGFASLNEKEIRKAFELISPLK